MARYTRNSAILAKIETAYGEDAIPSGVANAALISNLSVNPLNSNNINRDLIRPYFGASEQLVGTVYKEVSFDVELAGSGAAGTAPAWGPLLRACAFEETINAAVSVDYTPITDLQESLTIYYYRSGVLHKLLGAHGDCTLKAVIGTRPVFSFKFLGLDGGMSAAANPSLTLSGWKTPLSVSDANTGDLLFGCTYAAGALSSGTAYPSRGLELPFGNAVAHTPLLGGETIDITNREIGGTLELDLTPAEEVAFMTSIKANSTQSLGMVHGTAAGNKVLMYMPAVQLISPSESDVNGRALSKYSLRVVPGAAGNDELRIVSL
ncbi:phage tail tube protein [Nitrosovibrio sp. Nv6]|uniref:phage tail tube protein n=1 Tax=Nitrosovibrio sp. Nv6 TaxID=1855340 RepID=UPI0008C240F0|nr:phage tail tube protein [Nitrosovibrio sp. Nv6]SEO64245.1 hypothetical protein SAMN05216316_0690 [Nitrosovibrio sp. Nv6]